MICIKTQYLGLNRILLLAIGLWPYQQSRLTRIQFNFLFAILMTSIIFQLTTFMTALEYTADLFATVMSSASCFTICMIKYYTFRIHIKTVKKLLIQLQQICNELKDKNEIAIIEKYGYIAKYYTVALAIVGICGVSVLTIVQFWIIFDNISMNATRLHRLQIVTEYFVDEEKYFVFIFLHITVALYIGAAAMVATGTIFIVCFKIFCGMFKISSYRFERAVKNNILQNITLKDKILRSEDLIDAINIHRLAMKLPKYFISKFGLMFFILAQVFVISLCFNFVRIVQILLSTQAIEAVLLPVTLAAINILYLFISNYLGQNMTDHNNYVFDTVYKVEWYVTPLHIQKIILFLLLNGSKKFTMDVGLFIPSLECFATLVKAAVSYFTVVLSTQ